MRCVAIAKCAGSESEKLQDVLKYLLIDHLKLGIKEIVRIYIKMIKTYLRANLILNSKS